MKILATILAISFSCVHGQASPSDWTQKSEEVQANLSILLESVEGLDPVEVEEMLGTKKGVDSIYAATPAAAVIAGMAAAAYAAGSVHQAGSVVEINDEEFDINIQSL